MLLFLFLVPLLDSALSEPYSREALQKKYPGFGTLWIPMIEEETGEVIRGYLTYEFGSQRFDLSPNTSEITFTLYTRQYPNGTKDIEDNFDKKKPTKFVTHGWLSSGTADTCILIKNGFLERYDANVFIMDWGAIAGNIFYPIPMSQTKAVGDFYGKFLNKLVSSGADPKSFHLVGHSLGAHVSGFAARYVKNGPVVRITGLDPALPGFSGIEVVPGGRLQKTDAQFVDIIHTSAGFLGIGQPIGHADFYPNGGSVPQPGCERITEMMEACSHGKSWRYFYESLISKILFMSHRCGSFEDLVQRKCKNESVPMGDPVPFTARGDYYLKTSSEAPYVIKDIDESGNEIDS